MELLPALLSDTSVYFFLLADGALSPLLVKALVHSGEMVDQGADDGHHCRRTQVSVGLPGW